jgi:hypothetical protein
MLSKFQFLPSARPIYKNIYRLYGSGPTKSVYLDFHPPRPAKFAVGFPSPGEWGPFEIYLPVIWNAPSFDRTYPDFSSQKQKKQYLFIIFWTVSIIRGHETRFPGRFLPRSTVHGPRLRNRSTTVFFSKFQSSLCF